MKLVVVRPSEVMMKEMRPLNYPEDMERKMRPLNSSEEIKGRADRVWSGPLLKPTRFRRWVLRHFLLDANQRLLYYSVKRRRMVLFMTVKEAKIVSHRKGCCLRVFDGKKSRVLCAESREALNEWLVHFAQEAQVVPAEEPPPRRPSLTKKRIRAVAATDMVIAVGIVVLLAVASLAESRLAIFVGALIVAGRVFAASRFLDDLN